MEDFYTLKDLTRGGATSTELRDAMIQVKKILDPEDKWAMPEVFVGEVHAPLADAYPGVTWNLIQVKVDPDDPKWGGNFEMAKKYMFDFAHVLAEMVRPNLADRALNWLGV